MYARTRSPLRKLSRAISSSRRSSASARPSSTIRLPYSVRLTVPLMISPTRSLNSSYWRLRSYSRTRWTMTCLAVCAAMRPKSIGGNGSTRCSPSWISGFSLRATLMGIWVSSFSITSTASSQRDSRTSPVLRSMVARMSFSWPYLARPAFCMACSIASSTSSRSMFFSRATAVSMCVLSIGPRWLAPAGWPGLVGQDQFARVGSPGLVRLRARGGGSNQRIRQHQLGAADMGERQSDLGPVIQPQPCGVGVGAEHNTREALAPVDRHFGLGAGQVAGEAVPVLYPRQRAVDAGRADFQRPVAGQRVLDVDHRAHGVGDRLAVRNGDQRPVCTVGLSRPIRMTRTNS